MRPVLAALPLCLLTMACERSPADPRGVDRHEVLVQVAATGTSDTRPDEARFTAGVQTIDATAAAASERNAAVINRVVEALRALGVRPEDVQSRQVSLGRIDYGRDRGRFQANNMIEVRVRNVEKVGEAIAATTDAGANVLSGPNLRVSDPNAANRSAYANAYRSARARAEAYAEAAGLRVARVLSIRDSADAGRPGHDYDLAAAETVAPPAIARAAAPPVPPGLNTTQVSVRVDFALAE